MSWLAIIVLGCGAVLALDAAGSLLSRRTGFRYTLLAPVSLVLYLATAFLTAGAADAWVAGTLGGAAIAATDATVGWRITRALGVDDEARSTTRIDATVATTVTLGGAAAGTLAGLLA